MRHRAIAALILLLFAENSAWFPEGQAQAATLTLSMTPTVIAFPDQDPDFFPSTQANSVVSVVLETDGFRGNQGWSLNALSRGNLTAGVAAISISSISWTAVKTDGKARTVFMPNGNFTSTVPGARVAGGTGNDLATADLTFSILNSWTYPTGNYSQVTDFTLSAP